MVLCNRMRTVYCVSVHACACVRMLNTNKLILVDILAPRNTITCAHGHTRTHT